MLALLKSRKFICSDENVPLGGKEGDLCADGCIEVALFVGSSCGVLRDARVPSSGLSHTASAV